MNLLSADRLSGAGWSQAAGCPSTSLPSSPDQPGPVVPVVQGSRRTRGLGLELTCPILVAKASPAISQDPSGGEGTSHFHKGCGWREDRGRRLFLQSIDPPTCEETPGEEKNQVQSLLCCSQLCVLGWC
uniref:Uncharacterized protein n=1 Tax=Molossus molossus TaxID=27622 RepID=A0A7J8CYZ5_MOLMO|nr:hypothetical protein HJG59_009435 [Molossus molossus]